MEKHALNAGISRILAALAITGSAAESVIQREVAGYTQQDFLTIVVVARARGFIACHGATLCLTELGALVVDCERMRCEEKT